jgi:hypothetical protein
MLPSRMPWAMASPSPSGRVMSSRARSYSAKDSLSLASAAVRATSTA